MQTLFCEETECSIMNTPPQAAGRLKTETPDDHRTNHHLPGRWLRGDNENCHYIVKFRPKHLVFFDIEVFSKIFPPFIHGKPANIRFNQVGFNRVVNGN